MGRIVNFSYFIFGDEEFFEVVSVGFGWMLLILGGCAQTSHTPCPSREGRFGRCFLVGNERFDGMVSPLERG